MFNCETRIPFWEFRNPTYVSKTGIGLSLQHSFSPTIEANRERIDCVTSTPILKQKYSIFLNGFNDDENKEWNKELYLTFTGTNQILWGDIHVYWYLQREINVNFSVTNFVKKYIFVGLIP